MVSFMTPMNAMMSLNGTYAVELTPPSVRFFFGAMCRKSNFLLVIEPES